MTYQHTIIVGNLGRDPEMKYTPSGQAVTTMSVATTHEYGSADGQRVKETTWWRVSVWGKSAESCQKYLKKGSKVLVEGRIVPDKQTGGPRIYTKQDGTASASFELNASAVRFLSAKTEQASPAEEEPF